MTFLVVDAFPFFNEFTVLNARLAELRQHVDLHIAAEATVTHRGEPKPTYLADALDQGTYEPPAGQAALLTGVVTDMPEGPDNWARERHQRDTLTAAIESLVEGFAGDDPHYVVILSTDADEIVNHDRLDEIVTRTKAGPMILDMTHFYYRPEFVHPARWRHPKAVRLDWLQANQLTLSDLRLRFNLPVVRDAGWHLGYFGNADSVARKIRSFAHQELDTDTFHAGIADAIIRGYVLHENLHLGRPAPHEALPQQVLDALAQPIFQPTEEPT